MSGPLCASLPTTVSAALCPQTLSLLAAQKALLSRTLVTSSVPSEFPVSSGSVPVYHHGDHLKLFHFWISRALLPARAPPAIHLSCAPFSCLPDLSVLDCCGTGLSSIVSCHTRSAGNLMALNPISVLLRKAQTYISSPILPLAFTLYHQLSFHKHLCLGGQSSGQPKLLISSSKYALLGVFSIPAMDSICFSCSGQEPWSHLWHHFSSRPASGLSEHSEGLIFIPKQISRRIHRCDRPSSSCSLSSYCRSFFPAFLLPHASTKMIFPKCKSQPGTPPISGLQQPPKANCRAFPLSSGF